MSKDKKKISWQEQRRLELKHFARHKYFPSPDDREKDTLVELEKDAFLRSNEAATIVDYLYWKIQQFDLQINELRSRILPLHSDKKTLYNGPFNIRIRNWESEQKLAPSNSSDREMIVQLTCFREVFQEELLRQIYEIQNTGASRQPVYLQNLFKSKTELDSVILMLIKTEYVNDGKQFIGKHMHDKKFAPKKQFVALAWYLYESGYFIPSININVRNDMKRIKEGMERFFQFKTGIRTWDDKGMYDDFKKRFAFLSKSRIS